MKLIKSILSLGILLYPVVSYSQVHISDSILSSGKAEQFKKELSGYLSEKAVYPQQSLAKNTSGDVILSCEIDKDGNLSEPLILKSPDLLLATNSVVTLNHLEKKWGPEEIDYIPFGKEYHFVFRYRIYMNVMPVDNKARAVKLFNDGKYEKALKAFDNAIRDNEYDHELFSLRAKCKEAIGDAEGALEDSEKAGKLKDDIMAVINVIALGRTTTNTVRVTGQRIVAVPVR